MEGASNKIAPLMFEIFLSVSIIALFLKPGTGVLSIISAVFIISLFCLAGIDWILMRLPNLILIIAAVFILIISWMSNIPLREWGRGLLLGAGTGALIYFVSRIVYKKEVFGFGDVKLMAVIGSFTGTVKFFPVFFLGLFAATLFSIIGIVLGKYNRKSKVPLGTFLCMALVFYIIFKDLFNEFLYLYILNGE